MEGIPIDSDKFKMQGQGKVTNVLYTSSDLVLAQDVRDL